MKATVLLLTLLPTGSLRADTSPAGLPPAAQRNAEWRLPWPKVLPCKQSKKLTARAIDTERKHGLNERDHPSFQDLFPGPVSERNATVLQLRGHGAMVSITTDDHGRDLPFDWPLVTQRPDGLKASGRWSQSVAMTLVCADESANIRWDCTAGDPCYVSASYQTPIRATIGGTVVGRWIKDCSPLPRLKSLIRDRRASGAELGRDLLAEMEAVVGSACHGGRCTREAIAAGHAARAALDDSHWTVSRSPPDSDYIYVFEAVASTPAGKLDYHCSHWKNRFLDDEDMSCDLELTPLTGTPVSYHVGQCYEHFFGQEVWLESGRLGFHDSYYIEVEGSALALSAEP